MHKVFMCGKLKEKQDSTQRCRRKDNTEMDLKGMRLETILICLRTGVSGGLLLVR
jgi:hypothetical protein